MGLTLGPILNMYVSHFANGTELIMTALGGTGAIFVGLSGYALATRKDFSFMAGFLFAGIFYILIKSPKKSPVYLKKIKKIFVRLP